MRPEERDDEELEHLLISRWLYRGGILVLIAVFAIILTLLGGRGFATLPEQLAAGLLVLCGIAAGIAFLVMRRQDHALLKTLRQRRSGGSTSRREGPGAGS